MVASEECVKRWDMMNTIELVNGMGMGMGIWNMDMYVCTVTTKTKPSLGEVITYQNFFSPSLVLSLFRVVVFEHSINCVLFKSTW